MRNNALVIAIGLIFIISVSPALLAQRNYYDLRLTENQMKKIDELELNLEKEISPLISKLRINNLKLRQLFDRANPDEKKIETITNEIDKIEYSIMEKEKFYDEKIRNLLTEEQKAIYDSYFRDYGYIGVPYGRRAGRSAMAGYGRGYYGRGIGRGNGRGYYRQGLGRLGRTNLRGYGRGFYGRTRLGRGPCGLGLGRFTWRNYGLTKEEEKLLKNSPGGEALDKELEKNTNSYLLQPRKRTPPKRGLTTLL
ncbi:hypothetical protein KA005_51525 [bacterium]|nr:hypothetical protein [bacterium]